jgi:sugar (pentulose or hexulose) kinase
VNYPHAAMRKPPGDSSEYPVFTSKTDAAEFCSGIINYYLDRLKVHYAQIKESVKLNKITVSGGFTQSQIWMEILEKVLDMPFEINNRQDAGLLGAVKIYKKIF